MSLDIDSFLELTDTQFSKLPVTQKLDVLYMNVKVISGIKRIQKMQWLAIGGLGSFAVFIFLQLWNHIS